MAWVPAQVVFAVPVVVEAEAEAEAEVEEPSRAKKDRHLSSNSGRGPESPRAYQGKFCRGEGTPSTCITKVKVKSGPVSRPAGLAMAGRPGQRHEVGHDCHEVEQRRICAGPEPGNPGAQCPAPGRPGPTISPNCRSLRWRAARLHGTSTRAEPCTNTINTATSSQGHACTALTPRWTSLLDPSAGRHRPYRALQSASSGDHHGAPRHGDRKAHV